MIRFPPKKILVPMDMSQLSYAAYFQAVDWARKFDARVEVVHVEPPPALAIGLADVLKSAEVEIRRRIVSRIRKRIGGSVRIKVLDGDPAVAILRWVRTHRPDLIVMGTHGRTGLSRMLLGSVAEEVVRRSPAPVLVVRGKPRPIRKVLAPVNFTDYSDYGFVYAAGVAAALKAALTAFHVYQGRYEDLGSQSLLEDRIGRLPNWVQYVCRPQARIKQGTVAQETLSIAAKQDLLVLVAHKKNELKEWVLGTTAEQILRQSKKPVLTVPAPQSGFRGKLLRRSTKVSNWMGFEKISSIG